MKYLINKRTSIFLVAYAIGEMVLLTIIVNNIYTYAILNISGYTIYLHITHMFRLTQFCVI